MSNVSFFVSTINLDRKKVRKVDTDAKSLHFVLQTNFRLKGDRIMNAMIFNRLLKNKDYRTVENILMVMDAESISSLLLEMDSRNSEEILNLIPQEKMELSLYNSSALEMTHENFGSAHSDQSYFETSVASHAKSRFLWLLVLMLSSTLTGIIITKYEDAFAAIPLLVSFIPMLMDTGGNCGSQSSTLVIRGLALDEIRFCDIFSVMYKELRIALMVSAGLAFANGVRILIMYHDLKLAIVIGISLAGTVVIAMLIGAVLPLIAKKLNFDPAIMAAPLITTIVDTCSIVIYFSIATTVFGIQTF